MRDVHWGVPKSMYKDPLEPVSASPQLTKPLPSAACRPDSLEALLRGGSEQVTELPPLPDLIAGVIELCEGVRDRVLLPLAGQPAEFAFSRDEQDVLVDCYGTESTPEVFLRHHRVPLPLLCEVCAEAARRSASEQDSVTMGQALQQLAQRLQNVQLGPVMHGPQEVMCEGGVAEAPTEHEAALSFGFIARLRPSRTPQPAGHDFADVHALLFDGELWGFAGDTRVTLARGPILLATQRMAAAVRLLLSGWQAGRDMNARLVSGRFAIAVRLQRGRASVEFTAEDGRRLSLAGLQVPEVALPILRLCTELLRKLVAVDRSQMRNLRVSSLRHELRLLRRIVKTRERRDGFENRDPERLRMASPPESGRESGVGRVLVPGLRYTERWRAEIEGLEASAVFCCDERIVVATAKLILALCRSTGDVLWSQPNDRAHALLIGRVLLTWHGDGEVRLIDIEDGVVYARTRLPGRLLGVPTGLYGGGGELPPTALITDGHKSLWAVDLRTGELRFRYRSRGAAGLQLQRAGRVLLVTSGDGSVDALDLASGEVVWRHWADARFCLSPVVVGQVAVAAAGEPNGGAGELYGIELYTGRRLWQVSLPSAPSASLLVAERLVVVPCGVGGRGRLLAIDPERGHIRFQCKDPGLGEGAEGVAIDGQLLLNTRAGRMHSLDLQSGRTLWRQVLSNPVTDDLPRSLSPLVSQGMLFVPAAQVHVLRPQDGATLTKSMACDLVPDFLHVDDRGHMFVAEESGHLRSYSTAPHLTLV